jgi:type III secretion protein W
MFFQGGKSMGMMGMTGNVKRTDTTVAGEMKLAEEEKVETAAKQVTVQDTLTNQQEEAINPFAALIKKAAKSLKDRRGKVSKAADTGEKFQKIDPVKRLDDTAEEFHGRNPEFIASKLKELRAAIKPGMDKAAILKVIQMYYTDVSLIDDVFEFLLRNTEVTDGELARVVGEAHKEFGEKFGRQIAAGHNIREEAQAAAEKGLGTPTTLRDLYRDITDNPRDSGTLFAELSARYDFKELKKVIDYLLHSLGSDMKSPGPSIEPGLLSTLIKETRSLQAVLGVYHFFKKRINLMEKLFDKEGMPMPPQITFQTMTKQFMALAAERSPSALKVLQHAAKLGVEKILFGKIITISQFRDGVREVSVEKIYGSIKARDELFLAIIEALEDLEDEQQEWLDRKEAEADGAVSNEKGEEGVAI